MNAITEETLVQPEEGAEAQEGIEAQLEQPQPEPEPPTPVRPLAQHERTWRNTWRVSKPLWRSWTTEGRLARAEAEEGEILDGSGAALSEEEQLERLSRTLALQKVLSRKLERGNSSGLASASGKLENAVREALRSLWHDLAALRARREEKHLAWLRLKSWSPMSSNGRGRSRLPRR